MIFVSIKLFATDLDGTLLNKNGEISPANKQAIIYFFIYHQDIPFPEIILSSLSELI